jgi:hypothetical protein
MPGGSEYKVLTSGLKEARLAISELSAQLRRGRQSAQELRSRVFSTCSGGACTAAAGGTGLNAGRSGMTATASGPAAALSGVMSGGVSSALRAALGGDFSRAIQSMLSSILRSVTASIGRSAGGGIGAGLLSGLLGGGLSLLLGNLLKKRERVSVDNTVRAEVLNFPQLSSLDYASNPASRLFGGRALARGPAFSVEISYKSGAEDIVTAKVAQKLSDINALQGMGSRF